MHIGTLEIPAGAGLSPMAGVTDAAMRLLCFEMGAAWAVSEMLSAKGWIYSGGKNEATRQLLKLLPGEGVVGLQLFGREPKLVAQAARELSNEGFRFIDLNFGCPAPKITGNGEGSALMREPELIGEIVSAVKAKVSLPVTAKIRAGWDGDSVNAPEVARICEQAGTDAITVHGRTREQQYAGRADRGVIRDAVQAVSCPVIGNGDVTCGADAESMIRETGCAAVQIGRAAEGNPWVFRDVARRLAGEEFTPPTPREKMDMAERHMELEREIHGDRQAILEMRKHIAWYAAGIPGAARFRTRINQLTDPEEIRREMRAFGE